jgi:hypothetical protein
VFAHVVYVRAYTCVLDMEDDWQEQAECSGLGWGIRMGVSSRREIMIAMGDHMYVVYLN